MKNTEMGASEVHRRLVELYTDFPESLEEALSFIHPEVVDHRGGRDGDYYGIDGWKKKWESLASGSGEFRDVSVTIEQNVESEDISVNRYTSRGTQKTSGQSYEVTSMDMIRVRDGKLIEHWAIMDQTAIQHQLNPEEK